MKGDFTRQTFRADRYYSAVLLQQGRVQLDADANEQAAIQLALARRTAADLIGQHGGPGTGFEISYVPRTPRKSPASLNIRSGRYYVDGILIDSTRPAVGQPVGGPEPSPVPDSWTYWDQPSAYLDQEREADELPGEFPFLVYLVAWEDLVTTVEDPSIAEPALGALAPDTAARAKVIWQVLPLKIEGAESPQQAFDDWVAERTAVRSFLAARTEQPDKIEDDPCILSPDAAYRGPENQLYRVEIHEGGTAADGATFKWSRDNGSVTFPIVALDDSWVTLSSLGRDDKLALHAGDRVEVVDDAYIARGESAPLPRVEEIDIAGRRVRLSEEPQAGVGRRAAWHPLLRRWDQRESKAAGGTVKLAEGTWLNLEDGVQVWFKPGGTYRTGDYWLIPARTRTADVDWPQDKDGKPLLAAPHGIQRHYAPLAWIRGANDIQSLRKTFQPLAKPVTG